MDEEIQTDDARMPETFAKQDEGTMTTHGPDLLAQGHLRKRHVSENLSTYI